jgi:hypothetical protein
LNSKNVTESRDLESDVWSEWLLHRRHADDSAYGRVVQAVVEGYADRVLEGGNPIANYSERDLLNMVRGAGFAEIHLQLHIDVMPSPITSWDVFLGSSPHPWAPTLKQILAEQFTSEERQFFEQMVRPTVESGKNVTTDRGMYLQAQRPFS